MLPSHRPSGAASPRARGLARRIPLLGAVALAACGHAGAPGPSMDTVRLPPAPPVTSDDDFERRRADYDALDVDDQRRPTERAALEQFALAEARRELARDHAEAALEQLKQAAGLYDPLDLAHLHLPDQHQPLVADDHEALRQLAADLEHTFSRRGSHGPVLLALAIQRSLGANDGVAAARTRTVEDWLVGQGAREQLVDDLEAAVAIWPSTDLAKELSSLYAAGDVTPPRALRHKLGDLGELFGQIQAPSPAFKLATLWLRLSRPDDALAAVRALEPTRGDEKVRHALERYTAKDAGPDDVRDLAKLVAEQSTNYLVAERVCRDATRRFPQAAGPWLCVGEIAGQLGQLPVAVRAFESAVRLEPPRWEAWEALAKLYQVRLFQRASDERPTGIDDDLARVEKLYGDARARFPDRALRPGMASALLEIARGHYNAGRVDEAVKYCERSLAIEPSVAAHEQLGIVALKRGQAQAAIAEYAKAIALAEEREGHGPPAGDREYWRAKLSHALGDALALDGNEGEAHAAWHRAVVAWEAFLRQGGGPASGRTSPEEVAEAELDRAKALHSLGERDRAIAALENAIDVAPERAPTYADALAFLVERGEREEALDVYHRALGRAEVSEYLKVYCTLWMMDLDRRAHAPEDPLGRAFLAGVDGAKWYQELARWATGREPDAELDGHADTPAKRAEAEFYRAMRRYEAGDEGGARQLWQRVLDTKMMAFFEYDMASYYLRHGAPSEPAKARPPQQAVEKPQIPDGSI